MTILQHPADVAQAPGSYWDLSERERAALTSEGVEGYLDYELMSAGVVRPRRPPSTDVPNLPELERVQVYVVRAGYSDLIAFDAPEKVDQFLKLGPIRVLSDYDAGSKVAYAEPLFHGDDEIANGVSPRSVATRASFMLRREELKRAEAARRASEGARKSYEDALAKVDKATSGVWADWHAMQAKGRECDEVAETLAEYLRMTGGDRALALRFLAKAFSVSRRADASEWFGGESFGAEIDDPGLTDEAAGKANDEDLSL